MSPLLFAALLLSRTAQDPGEAALRLIRDLGSESVDRRDEAGRRLKEMGRPAFPALEKAVRGSDPEAAARAREILEAIVIRERLSPALLVALPGVDDRLARAGKRAWLEAFLEAADTGRHPKLKPGDLDALAGPALRAAEGYSEKKGVLQIVSRREIRGAALEVVRLLADDDVRSMAAEILGRIRTEEAVREAVKLLEHKDVNVRMNVVAALEHMRAREAVPDLVKLLQHPDAGVQESATSALGKLRAEEAIPALVERLKREAESKDAGSWHALVEMASPKAADAVAELLASEHPGVRREGLRTLGAMEQKIGAPKVPTIAERLRDADPVVRRAAVYALSRLKAKERATEIVRTLSDADPEVRSTALQALATLGAREAAPLVKKLLGDPDWGVRLEGVRALAGLEARTAVPEIVQVLKDPDPRVRWEAAEALQNLRAQELIPGLRVGSRYFLGDATPEEETVWAKIDLHMRVTCDLGNTVEIPRGPVASRVLLKMIQGGDIRRVRIVSLFGETRSFEGEEFLIRTLDDPDPAVCLSAVWSLGKLGSQKAVDRVCALLKDPAFENRDKSHVAYALGLMGDPKALPSVKACRNDPAGGFNAVWIGQTVLMLEIAGETDPGAREKRLLEILKLPPTSCLEATFLKPWAARKLADFGHVNGAQAIRAFLEEAGGLRGLGKKISADVLLCVHKLGGALSDAERQLLRDEGLLQ